MAGSNMIEVRNQIDKHKKLKQKDPEKAKK